MNKSDDYNNHWIAGFVDADGSFQIKIIKDLYVHHLQRRGAH